MRHREMRYVVIALFALAWGCSGAGPMTQAPTPPTGKSSEESPRDSSKEGSEIQAAIKLSPTQVDALKSAEVILIGETHDHPLHHQIQAEVIRLIKPKSVAFEMLDERHQATLDALGETPRAEWDQALKWSARGWPDFKLYAPVFDASLAVKAKLIGAHPTPRVIHPLKLGGSLPEALRERLKLDAPLPDAEREALTQVIREAHCGHAPPRLVSAMIKAQRLKDAWMADQLIRAPKPVVLIVGRGHTHPGYGIPWALGQLSQSSAQGDAEAGPRLVTLSLASHEPSQETSHAAQGPLAPVTLNLKTPPHRQDDPCERFKRQLEKMRQRHSHH